MSGRARRARSPRRNSSAASSMKACAGPTSTSPAWRGATRPGTTFDKGATGYGVRLLDQFVEDTAEALTPAGEGRRGCGSISTSLAERQSRRVLASLAAKLLDGRPAVAGGRRRRSDARPARPPAVGPGRGELPSPRDRRRSRRRAPADPAVDQPRCAQPRAQPRSSPTGCGARRRSAYDRAFYLFDAATLDGARLAWKLLAGRDGVDRHYWAQDEAAGGSKRPKPCSQPPPAARRCGQSPTPTQETARPWRPNAPFRSSSPTPPAAT